MSVMTAPIVLTRRAFLADVGRGAIALTVVGIAGCAPAASGPATPGPATTPQPTGGTSSTSGAGDGASDAPPSPSSPGGATGAVSWERVNLGFVSAYVLVRGGEAAVVDTGVVGSEDDIEAVLGRVGLDWGAVGHVVLTHMHPDHAGSAAAVLDKAPDATGYAGAEDIAAIAVPRPLTAVADDDRVFDLRIVRDARPHGRPHLGPGRCRRDPRRRRCPRHGRRRPPGLEPAVHRRCGRCQGLGRETRRPPVRDAAGRPRRADPQGRLDPGRGAGRGLTGHGSGRQGFVGWPTGLEPVTSGATIQCSAG